MSEAFDSVWESQARWSEMANQLKIRLGRSRMLVLVLTTVGAVFVTLGGTVAGFDDATGKVLGVVGATALALAAEVSRRSTGQARVRDWVRARSVSEGLKTELYFYLTRTGGYADAGQADRALRRRRDDLVAKVNDLGPRAEEVTPAPKTPPPVADVPSYVEHRLTPQIDDFYLTRVREQLTRLKWLRRAEYALTLMAAALGAVAAVVASDQPALWVPVMTTAAAAVTAHIAAGRYELQIVSYYATARKLSGLRDQWRDGVDDTGGPLDPQAFVAECENAISVENQAWMADWLQAAGARSGGDGRAGTAG